MPPANSDRASLLLVDECFRTQDTGFVAALRKVASVTWLATFADRWKADPRPWARQQIFSYLELPANCPGHQPVFKRLYKTAEEKGDTELIGAFLVAFDRLVNRVRKKRWNFSAGYRQAFEEEYLGIARNVLALPKGKIVRKDGPGEAIEVGYGTRTKGLLFNYRTRSYLRRRAWSFFRKLAYQSPKDYPAAVVNVLRRYTDADLAAGENILDRWALLQICFRGCDALEFGVTHVNLQAGRSLSELRAAPRFASAWETSAAARLLLDLLAQANAHLVRAWAMELFRRVTAKVPVEISVEELLALLEHPNEQVQQLGAELFNVQPGLEKLPVSLWLRLLEARNVTALATLSEAFGRHVSGERLDLAQTLALACAKPSPVARLGWKYLQARTLTAAEIPALSALADARCEVIAGELAAWALARLGTPETYVLDTASRFFDSLTQPVRQAAWVWLVSGQSPAYADATLWSRLTETPYDDLRLKLVDHLAVRATAPSADRYAPVWTAVLLGVHRGGRQKAKAVRQLAAVVAAEPERAAQFLPVLAVAVRSVRGPEMRSGLAAMLTVLAARPELDAAIRHALPELTLEATA